VRLAIAAAPGYGRRQRITTVRLSGAEISCISPTGATAAVPEVGRNDPCPCGSGKKYKKCHGVGR